MSVVNEEICSELGVDYIKTSITQLRYMLEDQLDEARSKLTAANEDLMVHKTAYDKAEEQYSRFMEENFS